MRVLELFSGTASVGREFQYRGHELLTVDNNPQFNPDICKNIFDVKAEDLGHPDVVWASPPCTCFSVASMGTHWGGGYQAYKPKTAGSREAIRIIEHTLQLIRSLAPKFWFMENPRGVLRKLPVVQGIPRVTVTYCQYGDTRMKPTDIWGTVESLTWRPICKNGDPCHERSPRGTHNKGTQGLAKINRARIPAALGRELCEQIEAFKVSPHSS